MQPNVKGSTPGPIDQLNAHPSIEAPPRDQPTEAASTVDTSALEKQWSASGMPAGQIASMPPPHGLPTDRNASANSSLEALTGDGVGNTYPEGGRRGWLVVFGAFIGTFACFGLMNSLAVFQAYIASNQLKDYDESTIGWIFSVYVFLAFFCGLQIGPVFDAKGPKMLLLAGSVLLSASMLLLGLCTEYYQFMLVFGILGGVGTSLIFTPAVSSIGHFFMARRGLATGFAAGGGALGGVVFPLMLQSLLAKLSFGWATRIIGFIFAGCTGIATLLVQSRLPPKPGSSVLPDFRIFRQKSFALTTLGVFMMEWGLFVPVTYIVSFSLATDSMSHDFAYQIIAVFNAASVFGRWMPGYYADKVGRFNLMTAALFLCALTTLALWLPADILVFTSEDGEANSAILGLTVTYAIVFGFASGSNLSLTPVCVGQLCETEEYGRYYATCYSVVSIGTLTGIPIAGVLLQACDGHYWGLIVFTGACYVVSVIAFWWARVIEAGWSWEAKY